MITRMRLWNKGQAIDVHHEEVEFSTIGGGPSYYLTMDDMFLAISKYARKAERTCKKCGLVNPSTRKVCLQCNEYLLEV